VIVVDNDSHDNSRDVVRRDFPWVRWIQSEQNLGFGRANNLGAKHATGKYLFLLNSDTVLLNNAIKIFYDYYEQNNHNGCIGAIGSYLLDDKLQPNHSYGSFPSVKSEWLYLFRFGQIKNISTEIELSVDYITGADLFIPRDVFNLLEGFDRNIFMYYEETDLQNRMSKLGLRRIVIAGPKIIHKDGSSFGGDGLSFSRFAMSQISFNYYMKKHSGILSRLWYVLNISLIRMKLLFQFKWTISQRIKAVKLVITQKTIAPQFQ